MTVEKDFMLQVLRPYSAKNCIYLQSIETMFDEQGARVRGHFHISSSCYIDDTGHFNAVEFNICYNQMFYVLLADGVRQQSIADLAEWDIATFLDKQLSHFLIVGIKNRFKSPINPKSFWSEGRIDGTRRRSDGTVFMSTSLDFRDEGEGSALGKVSIAVLPVGSSH